MSDELLVDLNELTTRLKAFARDCVHHGDMTPMAERQLHHILGNVADRLIRG